MLMNRESERYFGVSWLAQCFKVDGEMESSCFSVFLSIEESVISLKDGEKCCFG